MRRGIAWGLAALLWVSGSAWAEADTTLSIPAHVTTIEAEAFQDVDEITGLFVPYGVTAIGARAFADCDALTCALLPPTLTDLATDAFEGSPLNCIMGMQGSAAETLAKANDIPFIALANYAVNARTLSQTDTLRITFYNIGRNDGILITCGDQAAFLDSGLPYFGPIAVDYMQADGIRYLKYYIATHGHADHIGGGPYILASIPTSTVLMAYRRVYNGLISGASTSAQKKAVEGANYVIMNAGQSVYIGGARVECIGPLNIYPVNSVTDLEENYNSLVLKVTYRGASFLLSSDSSVEVLRAAEAKWPGILRSDVYKNLHHNGTTAADVLKLISPQITVFSTESNYLPSDAYLSALRQIGSQYYITSSNRHGTTVVEWDGANYTVTTRG